MHQKSTKYRARQWSFASLLTLWGCSGGMAIAAMPEEVVLEPSTTSMGQVNNVFQLRDVAPADWAFDALRNLVEKYNCLVGYPDGTFRGDRPLSRYEFAAGLNACMQQLERQIADGGEPVDGPDLVRLQRLVQEFQTELATLGARVDDLEGRVSSLENHQFSTTTKLDGKVIFAAITTTDDDNEITFGDRVRLTLDTSFTGQDNLRVRLAAANAVTPNLGTSEGSLAFADGESGGNDVAVDVLAYAFPLTEKLTVAIAAADDVPSPINALDGDGDALALTAFGTRNPIYYQIEGAGIGLEYALSDRLTLSAGYMAPDANDPNSKAGLFNGAYGALGQLQYKPGDRFEIAFTYLNGYNISDTGTGSNLSNLRSFTEGETGQAIATSSNSYGIEASWQLNDHLILGGWAGYSKISALDTLGGRVQRGSMDVWNWAATAAFPDLFTKGATGGLIIGMEPKVTASAIALDGVTLKDADTSLHVEAFYQYPINDHITITPGIIWLTAPDHNSNNDDILIGTIRTLFSF